MKSKFYPFLILMIAFTACQKELSFETSATTSTGTGTGSGTGGSSSTADCKACAYLPICNGSVFTYNDTVSGRASVVTDTFRVIKDTTIAGNSFQKVYSPLSNTYGYYSCSDGNTRIISYNSSTLNGNTQAFADITFLKANLAVGGTWQDTLINSLAQTVIYKNQIAEKGISHTVNGKTFTDVIHVYSESGVDVPGLGYYLATQTDYYFAKGVGLIEIYIFQPAAGTVLEHRTIKSYSIP